MATSEEQQVLTINDDMNTKREEVNDTKDAMDDKCKLKISIVINIVLIAIIIIIVLCGVYADAFGRYTECDSISNNVLICNCSSIQYDEDDEIPDGNQYEFNTTVCENYRDLWQDPSIPLDERNQIGRAIFQTPKKMQQAIELITYGKAYDLYRSYSRLMTLPNNRYFNTTLECAYSAEWDAGSCTQTLATDAIGNVGTQMDALAHYFHVDTDNVTSEPENYDYVMFNNFRGDHVLGTDGVNYLGVEKLPTFFTRAILVDIAGYKQVERLPNAYNITVDDFNNALEAQSLSVEDITKGDVVLVYTGWGLLYETQGGLFYDGRVVPGLSEAVVKEIIFPRNVMIVGSDNCCIDALGVDERAAHLLFIACGGGFNHEVLKLDEWVTDARTGDAPWIGAYLYQPLPVLGAVGSPGKPVVFV